MRQERTVQASLFDLFAAHEIGRELKAMSQWLDEHRELIGLAAEDLRRHGVKETGREGLPAESVLRCALLKQHRQLSYEELAFHLEDSASFRAFARLPLSWTPKKSALHRTISAIRAETWEAINRILLISARQEKVETGKVVRLEQADDLLVGGDRLAMKNATLGLRDDPLDQRTIVPELGLPQRGGHRIRRSP